MGPGGRSGMFRHLGYLECLATPVFVIAGRNVMCSRCDSWIAAGILL